MVMVRFNFLLAMLAAAAASSTVVATTCKPLSKVLSMLPANQDNFLNTTGESCFSLSLDFATVPTGRSEADLRRYYVNYLWGATLHFAQLVAQAGTNAPPTLIAAAAAAQQAHARSSSPNAPLETVQQDFKNLIAPTAASLSNVTLEYKDLKHYKLSFHNDSSPNPMFYYQNGVTTSNLPSSNPGFADVQRQKPYNTNLLSGMWSLEYHNGLLSGGVSATPMSTVQLGVALNGRPLTHTLEPSSSGVSSAGPRPTHYVVNGDGLRSGFAGTKTMGFGIVASPLELPSCNEMKSAYTQEACCTRHTVEECTLLKSIHKKESCCGGSSGGAAAAASSR